MSRRPVEARWQGNRRCAVESEAGHTGIASADLHREADGGRSPQEFEHVTYLSKPSEGLRRAPIVTVLEIQTIAG